MEREIRLYGPLAKFIGQRKFLAEISSAGEAIRMLLANFPGLERHMADQYYKVIVDSYESDLGEIHYPASQTIKIVPVLGGAGGGVGKIVAGVALIAISLALPGGGLFGGTAFGIFGGPFVAGLTQRFLDDCRNSSQLHRCRVDSWWRFAAAFTNASAWSDWSGFS
jgi:predicted phage tail protein